MTVKKWTQIQILYDDGTSAHVSRYDLEKLDELAPILEGLQRAKQMQKELKRLLGEAE